MLTQVLHPVEERRIYGAALVIIGEELSEGHKELPQFRGPSPNFKPGAARKVAKVAVARKILTLCFYGLRDGEIRCLARRCQPSTTAVMAVSS